MCIKDENLMLWSDRIAITGEKSMRGDYGLEAWMREGLCY